MPTAEQPPTDVRPLRTRLAPRIVTLGLALLVALVIAEGAVRLLRSVLSREVSVDYGEGRRVIYCIGDSFTYGLGLERSEAYPLLLQASLDSTLGPGRVLVRNLGTPGRSSSDAKAKVVEALRNSDAALLLVWTGWNVNDNDIRWHRERQGQPVPWRERIDGMLENSVLYRVAKQAATYRQRTVVLEGVELVPPSIKMKLYEFRAYQEICLVNLEEIVRLARGADVPLVLINYPYQKLPKNRYTETELYHLIFGRTPIDPEDYVIAERGQGEIAIHSVIRHVAERHAVPTIDLQEAFRDSGRGDLFQEKDLHHPTAVGARLVADTVHDAIVGPLKAALEDR